MSFPAMKMIRLMLPLALASTFVAHLVWSTAAALKTGFVYCPAYPCQCESDDGALVINCRHLFLSSLPKFLSYSGRIKELSLRHNSIRRLPANSFPDLNIQSLDILHNVVSYVHPEAFVGMESSLKSLSLQMYAYTGFPVDALSKLKALTLLVIQGCRVPMLHRNHFRNLTSLEELHLLGCRIRDVAPGTFDSMISLNKLKLTDNLLTRVSFRHQNKLLNILQLDLSSNRIESLRDFSRWIIPKLQALNLSKNKILSLSLSDFENVKLNLEYLNLNGNKITQRDILHLKNLNSLIRLDLNNNNISNLSHSYFSSLPNLRHLEIAHNKICALPSISLKRLEDSLTHLDLGANPLSIAGTGLFERVRFLESSNITKTNLDSLQEINGLRGLKTPLSVLDANQSGLRAKDIALLRPLQKLVYLNISFNRISQLDLRLFRAWPQLRSIDLSHNNISVLLGSMSNKTSLELLDLSWNSISTIKECAMYNVKSLKQFALHNNPLSCTCINSWLFLWRHSQRGLDIGPWRCKSPKQLKNRSFTDLSLSDFGCQNVSNTENPECTNRQARGPYFSSVVPGLFRIRLNINIDIVQNCSFKIRWSVDENKDEISNFRIVLKHRICQHRKHSITERSDSVIISFPGSVVEHVFSQEDIISNELVCVQALNKSSEVVSDVCKELITCVTNCMCDTGIGITELANDDFQKEQLEEALRNTFIPILLIYITCTLALIITIAVALVYLFNSKWRSNKLPPSCDQRRSDCFDHRTSMTSSLPISNADFSPSEVSQVLNHTDHEDIGHSNSANPQTSEMVPDRHYDLNGQYVSYNMTRDLPKIETSRNFLRPALVEVIAGQRSRFDSVSQTDFEPNRFTQSEIEEDEFYFFF